MIHTRTRPLVIATLLLASHTLPAQAQSTWDTHSSGQSTRDTHASQTSTRDTHQSSVPNKKEKEIYETNGALGGLALGALAGGPVGAVLSTAVGGWLGNKLHDAKISRHLQAELELSQQHLFSLQEENRKLEQDLFTLNKEIENKNLLASTNPAPPATQNCCIDSELTLHFRSNSAELEMHYLPALREFAKLAESLPGAKVEISGYTDRRGENANNLALSQKRVQEVESALREMGLRKARVMTSALGEKFPQSAADNFEANFFDRRVLLRLVNEKAELLSQTHP